MRLFVGGAASGCSLVDGSSQTTTPCVYDGTDGARTAGVGLGAHPADALAVHLRSCVQIMRAVDIAAAAIGRGRPQEAPRHAEEFALDQGTDRRSALVAFVGDATVEERAALREALARLED